MRGLADRKIVGVLFACAGYGMYSLHYATMKWLDTGFSLGQLTFARSAVMLAIALAFAPRGTVAATIASPYKFSTAVRAGLQLLSVLCFFTAAGSMSLAEVTTLYSTAPIIIVILSVFLLGEKVRGFRWLAIGVGIIGTIVAANPGAGLSLAPMVLALGSGLFWALTVVFTRKSGARESAAVQLVTTSAVFLALSLTFMTWKNPATLAEWLLLVVLGIQIYLAQYFFIEACRFAPASLVGPLEYSSVVWSCILGYLIFADVPAIPVVIGAALVTISGVVLALGTGRDTIAAELLTEPEPMIAQASGK